MISIIVLQFLSLSLLFKLSFQVILAIGFVVSGRLLVAGSARRKRRRQIHLVFESLSKGELTALFESIVERRLKEIPQVDDAYNPSALREEQLEAIGDLMEIARDVGVTCKLEELWDKNRQGLKRDSNLTLVRSASSR